MTDKTKKLLHSYGFFTCILLLMFTILLLVVYFSRNCGHKTIIKLLQEKLDTFYETEYKVGESVNMALPLHLLSERMLNNMSQNSHKKTLLLRLKSHIYFS